MFALPGGAFAFVDEVRPHWYRVDRAGRVGPLPSWDRLDDLGAAGTVAGTGADGPANGDGGPASAAVLSDVEQVTALRDGSFLFVDGTDDATVRHVDLDGAISTVAGGGSTETKSRCLRSGTPARSLRLRSPQALAMPDGPVLLQAGAGVYRLGTDDRRRFRQATAATSGIAG